MKFGGVWLEIRTSSSPRNGAIEALQQKSRSFELDFRTNVPNFQDIIPLIQNFEDNSMVYDTFSTVQYQV